MFLLINQAVVADPSAPLIMNEKTNGDLFLWGSLIWLFQKLIICKS